MEWLDLNLDAYRILGEILNDLRVTIQEKLKENHGSEWFRETIPSSVFDRLVSTKEGETAIDWYDSEYQQVMDFAVFPDLFEILMANEEEFPHLLGMVHSPSLLQARFLELEVLRAKVGRARAVSEAELTFMMKFHTRFRQALIQHRSGEPVEQNSQKDVDEVKQGGNEVDFDSGSEDLWGDQAPVSMPKPISTEPVTPPEDHRKPQREAQTFSAPEETPKKKESAEVEPPAEAVIGDTLTGALEKGDSMAVLRYLFKEVTALAESLWSSDVPPRPTIWNAVRTSPWYEENFTPLGLKPLSDFFAVINEVEKRMTDGLEKQELQGLLEESNFAQVLLALRDMFQRNRV